MIGAGLVAACDDPKLLAFPLWPAQRERLAEVEAGPRVHVWSDGRRSTKSTRMALIGLWSCLLRPELRGRLRPGERGYAVAVATNLRQARVVIRSALSIVEASPLLAGMIEGKTEDEIRFANGMAFAAFPCSSRGGRGWPVHTLLLDEFAHFMDEGDGSQVAEGVWRALLPSTAQFGELARIVVGSTPFGSSGFFADLWARAASGELPGMVARRAASVEMNPTLTAEFLEGERAVLGEDAFASEYLAEFVGSGGAFLDPEVIVGAVDDDRAELPPGFVFGDGYVAGLDPAFSSDPFGLAIVGRSTWDRRRLVLAVARSWKPQRRASGSMEESRELEDRVLDEVAEECLRYGARVVTDQYRASGVAEYLRRRGLQVAVRSMTAPSKTAMFMALRARLNLGGLELYRHEELLAELRRLTTRFTAGQASVRNPRVGGSHGDIAQALALGVWEHDRGGILRRGAGLGGSGDADEVLSEAEMLRRRRERSGRDGGGPLGYGASL